MGQKKRRKFFKWKILRDIRRFTPSAYPTEQIDIDGLTEKPLSVRACVPQWPAAGKTEELSSFRKARRMSL